MGLSYHIPALSRNPEVDYAAFRVTLFTQSARCATIPLVSRKRYPLRVARDAHGIRAQDLRTLARKDWWARRWIASLEAMRLGPRFGRGRQYATAGQVTELMLDGPHVEATVVGSREAPYRITLDFTSATGETLERIVSAIAAEPMLLGRLLTDNLPTEIETLFRTEGLPLFPQAAPQNWDNGHPTYDVKMHCSCPDWARPCKHLVAVMLLLGEEVAQRPSTILSLRGIEIEDLVHQGLKAEGLSVADCRLSSTFKSPLLTHSPTPSLPHSLTPPLHHSLTPPLPHSSIHPLPHALHLDISTLNPQEPRPDSLLAWHDALRRRARAHLRPLPAGRDRRIQRQVHRPSRLALPAATLLASPNFFQNTTRRAAGRCGRLLFALAN